MSDKAFPSSILYDLNLALSSKIKNKSKQQQQIQKYLNYLKNEKYSIFACSIACYEKDINKIQSKPQLISNSKQYISKQSNKEGPNNYNEESRQQIPFLQRLNLIIDDVNLITQLSTQQQRAKKNLLNWYDILTIAPQNEDVFHAACTNTMCHVISIDYYTQGKLPYKLKPHDIKIATSQEILFEIDYAPALVDPDLKQTFLQICHDFSQSVYLQSSHAKLIVSSGSRIDLEDCDAGTTVLRSCVELSKIFKVYLDDEQNVKFFKKCMSLHPSMLLNRILEGKCCSQSMLNLTKPKRVCTLRNDYNICNLIMNKNEHLLSAPLVGQTFDIMNVTSTAESKKVKAKIKVEKKVTVKENNEEEDDFIAF